MELTGKCKDDFLKYFKERFKIKASLSNIELIFEIQDELFKNALIIEFFDSVGIYIEIRPIITPEYTYSINANRYDYSWYKTRPEAQTEAIKKANLIYNEKK